MQSWHITNRTIINHHTWKIERSFWRWSPVQGDLAANGVAPNNQADSGTQSITVWADDGAIVLKPMMIAKVPKPEHPL